MTDVHKAVFKASKCVCAVLKIDDTQLPANFLRLNQVLFLTMPKNKLGGNKAKRAKECPQFLTLRVSESLAEKFLNLRGMSVLRAHVERGCADLANYRCCPRATEPASRAVGKRACVGLREIDRSLHFG